MTRIEKYMRLVNDLEKTARASDAPDYLIENIAPFVAVFMHDGPANQRSQHRTQH